MLVSLTVGKVDAGVTVLLTPDKRLVSLTCSHTNMLLGICFLYRLAGISSTTNKEPRSNFRQSSSHRTSPLGPSSTLPSRATQLPSPLPRSASKPYKTRSTTPSALHSPPHHPCDAAMPHRPLLSSSGTPSNSQPPTSSASLFSAMAKRLALFPSHSKCTRQRSRAWQSTLNMSSTWSCAPQRAPTPAIRSRCKPTR